MALFIPRMAHNNVSSTVMQTGPEILMAESRHQGTFSKWAKV